MPTVAQVVADRLLTDTLTENGIQPQENGYTYIDGTMVRNAVSRILAGVVGIERVVRPRICGTEKFTAEHNVDQILNVTVELDNFMGIWTRTLGPDGTPNKNGLINFEAPVIASTVPFNIPLTQLNDQPLFFPRMQLIALPYDRIVNTLANYGVGISMAMDAYHIAKTVASTANYAKSVNSGTPEDADNVIKVIRANVYNDNYMAQIYNEMDAKLAEGDPTRGAMTYTGPRGIVAKPEFINWSRTPNNGWISNASDIGQRILLEPTFSLDEARMYGASHKGNLKGYDLLQANKNIWFYVEQYLALNAGDLDKVLGVIMNPMAYAMGGVAEAQVMLLQSTDYAGVKGFPFHKFGGGAYRKMHIIIESDFTFPAKLVTGTIARVVAPASWSQVTGKGTKTIENTLSDGQNLQIVEEAVTEPSAYQIKGTCKLVNAGALDNLQNVLLTATNIYGDEIDTATSAADGTYTLDVEGDVIVTPTLAATTFTPVSIKVSQPAAAEVLNVDFVGVQ